MKKILLLSLLLLSCITAHAGTMTITAAGVGSETDNLETVTDRGSTSNNVLQVAGLGSSGTISANTVSGNTINSAGAFTLPKGDGSSGQVMKTDGSGIVTWANDNNSGSSSLDSLTGYSTTKALQVGGLGTTGVISANTVSGNTIYGSDRVYSFNSIGAAGSVTGSTVTANTAMFSNGDFYLANSKFVYGRNTANNAWYQMMTTWSDNYLYIGYEQPQMHFRTNSKEMAYFDSTTFWLTKTTAGGAAFANFAMQNSIGGADKYVYFILDDTDDYYHLARQDANVLGFKVDMPFSSNSISSSTVSFNTIVSQISTSTVIIQGAYKLPQWDGTSGQVLTTDGQGSTSWSNVTSGGSGAPTDADYLVGTANGSLSAEIVVGTSPGGSLGGTWASPTIDDLFLLNSASDVMTGTLTTDGYALDADELITFGTKTLKYETTRTDFILGDDLIIEDIHPGIYIRSTDDNRAYGWHYHPNTPYPFGLWRGQDTGSGIAVNPNVPLIGIDDNNVVYFPNQIYLLQGNLGTADFDADPDVWIIDVNSETFPKGIVITDVVVDCNEADPTTELNADLKYCDNVSNGAFPGANAVTIKALDTTTGNMSDTALGTGVPAGKTLYITIDADPISDTTLFHVRIHYKVKMN